MTRRNSISPTCLGVKDIGDLEEGEDEVFGEGVQDEQVEAKEDEMNDNQEEVEFREFETSITPNAVKDPGAPQHVKSPNTT